ncbi:MAG: hypothetical protein LBO79_08860 [Zoogloeaceae bacterium]|jgi:hypothetical protein|nr:hypothetical protein [Zoogloeaceae bacterium]
MIFPRIVLSLFCLTLLLGACARNAPAPQERDPVLPPEKFKVHPELLGQPASPESQTVENDQAGPDQQP